MIASGLGYRIWQKRKVQGIHWPGEETGNDKSPRIELEDKSGLREDLEGSNQYRNEPENTEAPLDELGRLAGQRLEPDGLSALGELAGDSIEVHELP